MRRGKVALIVVVFSLVACNTLIPSATPTPTAWQDTVDGMVSLTRELKIPDHFRETGGARTGTEFDVNEYFTVLTHLSMEEGYVLDYVYYLGKDSGIPIVYARQEGEARYSTPAEYEEAVGEDELRASRYLEHVRGDGTAEGYFELVVLSIMANQFYLYRHALQNDKTVVCDRETVEAVIEGLPYKPMSAEAKRAALGLDFEPRVEFEDEVVWVRVVTFTKWGGFFQEEYTISRSFPHLILEHEEEQLVPYNCGFFPSW